MKLLKERLMFMLFNASTDFSELLLGSVSFVTGLWLILPLCHWAFIAWQVRNFMPEVWGTSLIVAGLLKLVGLLFNVKKIRILSAFIATIVWTFLTFSWVSIYDINAYRFYVLSAPITFVLGVFNGFIYVKLRMIHINVC